MSGESYFYIFTRGKDQLSNKMAVVFIHKEYNSSRKFINFAILENNELEEYFKLKTLKKQEIPKQGIPFAIYI